MIRRPPRSTLSSSSAASDVYKRQEIHRPPPGVWNDKRNTFAVLGVGHHVNMTGYSMRERSTLHQRESGVLNDRYLVDAVASEEQLLTRIRQEDAIKAQIEQRERAAILNRALGR
eukprot:TRINITY_DN2304_c0_g1_i3.p1 TRINITY_DN2304_c0_g1~~TRINITY_DN2304_c0_g1_i3.p1  ORF type:complete len:115 (+),score=23.62 TRINITY_DN2304_c0_g1_i3:95-439(+)